MKKLLSALVLPTFILTFTFAANTAIAFRAPYNTVDMKVIIKNAQDAGLVYMNKIEYDNDTYIVDGIIENGLSAKVKLDPQTGKVLSEPLISEKILTMVEAVDAAEKAGYNHIYGIEMKDGHYQVDAIDKENRKAVIDIDYLKGTVGTEWF